MSETPEIQRKSRKLFAARTRDVDKIEADKLRKRSLTNPRSSVDESESSRKSSVSSGRKKDGKQFAVTLLVNDSDKTKIMDMLHKAKSVISRKMEKVMGKKAAKAGISNADALRTVLENWVENAEKEEQEDDKIEDELIKAQAAQVEEMRQQGFSPPVTLRPIPTTVVSPVPEEEDEDEEVPDDIEVQEVFEGQTSFLLPPKAGFKLERATASSPPMSPTRSLTPCDNVPRPAFLQTNDSYKLQRPSSLYDSNAQAASSRPTSRQGSIATPPVFDYSAFARAKTFDQDINWDEQCQEDSTKMQRPESMIIPIGGVWRPEDEAVEGLFEKDDKVESSKNDDNRLCALNQSITICRSDIYREIS